MVANKGMKRKSLAPQSLAPKKSPKVTSISANNTPAKKRQTLLKRGKLDTPLKKKNVVQPSPKKMQGKQKSNMKKVQASDSEDDDDDEEDSVENSDFNIEEDDSEDENNTLGNDDSLLDDDSADEEESGENEEGDDSDDTDEKAEEVKQTIVSQKKLKENKLNKNDSSAPDKISSSGKKVSKESGYVLFVGNLNFKTTEDEVRQYFRKAGIVVGVNLANFRTGLSRGFGFVEMKDEEGYKKALKLTNSTLQDRKINVEVTRKTTTEKVGNKPKKNKKAKK